MNKNKTANTREEFDILGNKAKIMRVATSGGVWQFRMWVSDEGKYIRKSLKTRDFEAAVNRAEKIVFQTMSDVATGRKIFGLTLGELAKQYEEWRQEDVELGNITAGRLVTIKSQLKHLLEYKGAEIKLSELDRNSLYDYANWRKKQRPGTREVTIRNEQATLNHMIGMAWRRGYSHFDKFDFRVMRIDARQEVKRRGIFSLEEYDRLVGFLNSYCSKENCIDRSERLERLLIRDCVLIASNTMLRMGELWNLKWGDVKAIENEQENGNSGLKLVTVEVRSEIAKTRRSRTVIGRGGQYFERLKSRAKYKTDDDYVFASIGGKSKLGRQKWYLHWKNLMMGIGLDYKRRNVTWYSLRHFGITCRLRAGVSLFDISRLAGTSVTNIENHYGHIDRQMLKRAALKSFTIDKGGLLVTDDAVTGSSVLL